MGSPCNRWKSVDDHVLVQAISGHTSAAEIIPPQLEQAAHTQAFEPSLARLERGRELSPRRRADSAMPKDRMVLTHEEAIRGRVPNRPHRYAESVIAGCNLPWMAAKKIRCEVWFDGGVHVAHDGPDIRI